MLPRLAGLAIFTCASAKTDEPAPAGRGHLAPLPERRLEQPPPFHVVLSFGLRLPYHQPGVCRGTGVGERVKVVTRVCS